MPGEDMAIIRPELEIVAALHFGQSLLHKCDGVGAIKHEVTGMRDRGHFIRRLDMNEMNRRPNFSARGMSYF
jgi:hypothetical protein